MLSSLLRNEQITPHDYRVSFNDNISNLYNVDSRVLFPKLIYLTSNNSFKKYIYFFSPLQFLQDECIKHNPHLLQAFDTSQSNEGVFLQQLAYYKPDQPSFQATLQ